MVTAPILREDSQREKTGRAAAHADVEFSHAWSSAALQAGRTARVFAHTEPPPGNQKPPTVLRI
jgi:hypothetical protein